MRSLIYWELLDESQLWWCNVEESFCRVIKMPWSTTHCHRLNQDDQQECRNKMIFPRSVNANVTGDQSTQDVLSSQRCEAEEESVVVLDSRYYSFTQRTIMESHFSTVVVKFCKSWCNRKKKGKRKYILIIFWQQQHWGQWEVSADPGRGNWGWCWNWDSWEVASQLMHIFNSNIY